MKLDRIESQSAVWLKLKEHIEDCLSQLRQQNDGDLSDIDTARLRGRVAMCKELLALEYSEQAEVELDDSSPTPY